MDAYKVVRHLALSACDLTHTCASRSPVRSAAGVAAGTMVSARARPVGVQSRRCCGELLGACVWHAGGRRPRVERLRCTGKTTILLAKSPKHCMLVNLRTASPAQEKGCWQREHALNTRTTHRSHLYPCSPPRIISEIT